MARAPGRSHGTVVTRHRVKGISTAPCFEAPSRAQQVVSCASLETGSRICNRGSHRNPPGSLAVVPRYLFIRVSGPSTPLPHGGPLAQHRTCLLLASLARRAFLSWPRVLPWRCPRVRAESARSFVGPCWGPPPPLIASRVLRRCCSYRLPRRVIAVGGRVPTRHCRRSGRRAPRDFTQTAPIRAAVQLAGDRDLPAIRLPMDPASPRRFTLRRL